MSSENYPREAMGVDSQGSGNQSDSKFTTEPSQIQVPSNGEALTSARDGDLQQDAASTLLQLQYPAFLDVPHGDTDNFTNERLNCGPSRLNGFGNN